jgi:biotin transport system substrate-specific component
MMRAQRIPVAFVRNETSERSLLAKLAWSFGFAVATAIGAQIQIPLGFTPVPITLQTLFVFSSGLFLGARFGLLSQLLYLFMGLVGLPVFSGASHGGEVMFGATGGYLIGFLLFSYFSGKLFYGPMQRDQKFWVQYLKLYLLSMVTVFGPGVFVLKIMAELTWWDALVMGYFPFIFGDLIKIALGLGATRTLQDRTN